MTQLEQKFQLEIKHLKQQIKQLKQLEIKHLKQQIQQLKQRNFILTEQLNKSQAYIFAPKRERNIDSGNKNTMQLTLFVDEFALADKEKQQAIIEQEQEKETQKKQQAEKKKQHNKKKNKSTPKKGIRKPLPPHLEREKIFIEPKGINTEQYVQIGVDITEILSYRRADMYVKQIIRPKYAKKQSPQTGIKQAPIPPRIIPRGMVDNSLVIVMIIDKIQYHIPLHRFIKKLKEQYVDCVKGNNAYNWFHAAAELLLPLYHLLRKDLLAQNYLQFDESPIQVINKNKINASTKTYMWVINSPQQDALLYHHDPSRGGDAIKDMVKSLKGFLQCDGYSAYTSLSKQIPTFTLVYCHAHARRKFVDALASEPQQAQYVIDKYKQLYAIERQAREQNMSPIQRHELRQQKSIPILDELGKWLAKKVNDPTIIPKSLFYKAIHYAHKRWEGLCLYAKEEKGILEIDNNLVENSIRPLALGRKNYLFAKSNTNARNLAILYSFIGTCVKRGINTNAYLTWVFEKVCNEKITDKSIDWLPHKVDPSLFQIQ